jgi:hypothetical protein
MLFLKLNNYERPSVSTTFLLGAGASYGSGPCSPYPPPLGRDLFNALVAQGGLASRLPQHLAAAFIDDFETGMDKFWHERNEDLTELQRDMARYLARFYPEEGNVYLKLIKIMGKHRKYVMATTNYDLLIELSAGKHGMDTTYHGLPVPENNVSILKIHGSCNFLPKAGVKFKRLRFQVANNQAAILETEVEPATSAAEVVRFCDENDSMAPAIAIYSPAKQVLFCPGLVKFQQAEWARSIREASRLYIIGMRVHTVDDHIWGEIAKVKVPVYYVGRQKDTFDDWAKSVGLKHGKAVASSFEEALPHIEAIHRRGGR